jgi:hypothetical protein
VSGFLAAAPIAIAATPVALGERGVADELWVIQCSPRAAAGLQLRDFYSWPGRELGVHFRGSPRKTTTYDYRPQWWEMRTF